MRKSLIAIALGCLTLTGTAHAQRHFENERRQAGTGKVVVHLADASGGGMTAAVWLCTANGARISQWHTEKLRRGRLAINNLRPGRYQLRVVALSDGFTDQVPPPPHTFEAVADQTTRVTLTAVAP
jgi:hypothetical protein